MTNAELTGAAPAATLCAMRESGAGARMRKVMIPSAVAGAIALAGCVTVNAPEEPIVIELNINIRQEVIYRLAEDAGNTIEENQDIF